MDNYLGLVLVCLLASAWFLWDRSRRRNTPWLDSKDLRAYKDKELARTWQGDRREGHYRSLSQHTH